MRKQIIFGLLILLLFNLQACAQLTNKAISVQNNEENHPVRKLYLSSIEAFNNGNLELFLAYFAEDIKMYGTDGVYEGKEALRNRFKVIFQQFPKAKMEIPALTLKILSDEVVLVDFKWKLYPMGGGPAYSGMGSGIYANQGGKWVEVLEVETVTSADAALRQ